MVATHSYCLNDEPWIPILRVDGRFERVGIRVALTEASRIRQLAATNPMDNLALLRFLLAVMYLVQRRTADTGRERPNPGGQRLPI